MTKRFYVDLAMCGDGEILPEDFDLEEFCAELQKRSHGVEIIALADQAQTARNSNPALVRDDLFNEVLADYCIRLEKETR